MIAVALALVLLTAALAPAQTSPAVAARQWRQLHERSILDELVGLLRIPNTGQDPADLRRNAESISNMFARRGISTRLIEAEGAPPVVYGELHRPGATQTLVFYAHYDGQPVNPSTWHTGDPFRPTLMSGPLEAGGQPIPLPRPGWPTDPEWRLYARSSGDDKVSIVALAVALEALERAQIPIDSNLKFFIEGEEEEGSPHLAQFLRVNHNLLASNLWFLCDGVIDETRQQQLIFGVRGVTGLEITVYGPRHELPSGQYGNWAPNPAMMLSRLLASFMDETGKVLVKGFYDDVEPLGEAERKAIAEIPDYGPSLHRELWLGETLGGGKRIEELINMPTLNVRGIESGRVGADARNVIPATARASIDIRLVKNMDHQTTLDRIIAHIEKQGFHVTESEPSEQVRLRYPRVAKITREVGYNPFRTPMDSEIARRVIAAVESARGPIIKLPTMGGNLPANTIEEVLGARSIVVPIANHDNNQHGPNENIRLQNIWDGIETMAALLALDDGRPAGAE